MMHSRNFEGCKEVFCMLHIAMIGKWHVHAEGYANEMKKTPFVQVDYVFDEDAQTAREWAKALECTAAESYEAILNDPQIGGVVICTATCDHEKYILPACRAGKAVFTEKVLGITAEGAEEIRRAVVENGVSFGISFPHKCDPKLMRAAEWVTGGKLGQVTYARVRNVHNGASANWLPATFYDAAQCGGGAMIDLGAHPMYTLCMLLGLPASVQSTFTQVMGKGVEDNAVSLLRYENGAIGVAETGFVSENNPYTLEVSGTRGALRIWKDLMVCCPDTDNQWVTDFDLPDAPESPIVQWARCVEEGRPVPAAFGIDQAVELSRVMDAAYRPAAGQSAAV